MPTMSPAASTPPAVEAKTPSTPGRRLPLHILLATAFTGLLLLSGLALITYSYFESRAIALLSADDLMTRITRQVGTDVIALYRPAQKLIDLSSHALAPGAGTLEQRLRDLDFYIEALQLTPQIEALYTGHADGDFFLVRTLTRTNPVARRLAAPAGSRFMVQSIERDPAGAVRASTLFLDASARLLVRHDDSASDFDPRTREWYQKAARSRGAISSGFYRFHTTGETGITFARRLARADAAQTAVVGADLRLADFDRGLATQLVTPGTRILVIGADGSIISSSARGQESTSVDTHSAAPANLPRLDESSDGVESELARRVDAGNGGGFEIVADGRTWLASLRRLPTRKDSTAWLATVIPRDELLADVNRVRDQSLLFSLAVLLIAAAIAVWLSRHIAASLRTLADEADLIRQLRFDAPITLRSRIKEVADLGAVMTAMKSSLGKFLEISEAISAEKDQARIMEMILAEARSVAHADGGALLLLGDDERSLETALVVNERTGVRRGGSSSTAAEDPPLPLTAADDDATPDVDRLVATGGQLLCIDDLDAAPYDCAGVRARFDADGYRSEALLALPMRNQTGEIIGVLQLVNPRGEDGVVTRFDDPTVSYMQALTSSATVALDLRRLLQAQKDLLGAFIHVIAGAIDAKSPYTSGHCQRVPELARMLAEAAHGSESGPFADFRLDDDEWYELHIASWLHDCGKVTTPEHVVDKATKLETIYNRIHEVRARFEILWRDAQIAHYRELAGGSADSASLHERLDRRLQELRADFAFIASCNAGGEFMDDDSIARLRRLAGQTWQRHFDDRIGLSQDELARRTGETVAPLPATEPLLADRPEHIIPRAAGRHPFGDNVLGFRMQVPEHEFNHGELYNLCIRRGTLTPEERFKINDHIVQTMIMLDRLPFPRELRRVPQWAANHHEKMDGSGYPRGLTGEDMSIPERIMAIADIYEALTAADRPYKTGKSVSESLRIMSFMRNDGHIDPALFELFLSSGVYREYAERFLDARQVDAVDLDALRGAAPA